jgi:ADP-ribose pyrophosphatase YjhB (NUDIX family)
MMKKIVGAIWRKLSPLARLKIVRATQTKFTASVAAIVENENGEILLLDHVLRPDSGWGIPGGFLGYGEQPAEAVRRELIEETGLELEMVEMVRVQVVNRHIEILFRAKAKGFASVKSHEINSARWFKVDAMPEKMNQTQKLIIKSLLKNGL